MASQVASDGHVVAPLNISAPAPSIDLKGFKWDTVDEKILGPKRSHEHKVQPNSIHQQKGLSPEQADAIADATQLGQQLAPQPGAPAPPLFPLAQFQGAYAGNGFNLIFRPQQRNDTTLPGAQGPNDNILELNLTTEQLTFGNTIGAVPNRGLSFNGQPDITIGGFPYLQTIQDVTNLATGKGDNPIQTGIHFETG